VLERQRPPSAPAHIDTRIPVTGRASLAIQPA
jgi:hypothetical protein